MTDWSLLGGTEPAPGDPAQLRMRLHHVDRAAEDMRELSIELSRIARGTTDADWRGEAAEAMQKVLNDFRSDLHPIATSFDNICTVLGRYATTVETLQGEARQALNRAKLAESKRQAAESQRSAAAASLASQRRSLLTRRTEEITHRAVTSLTIDPAAQAVEASQGEWLATQTAQAERAVADSAAQVHRLEATIANAKADLQREQSSARDIREEWERASTAAKIGVEGALSEQLLNLSYVEKAYQKLVDGVGAIDRFVQDPLPYIAELRKVIEKVQSFISKAAMFVGIAAKIAGLLSFIPGMAAVAAGLATVATVLTVVALVLAAAKLLTGLILVASGSDEVGLGDLAIDGVDVALALVPGGGKAKIPKKQIHDAIRRGAILRWGSYPEVTKEVLRMSKDVLVSETKGAIKSEAKSYVKEQVRTRLNQIPRNVVVAPIPRFNRPALLGAGGGSGGSSSGGGGW